MAAPASASVEMHRVEDESQFAENHEEDSQIATPEIFVPHVLSAEESDAPGDGTDDPAPDFCRI